MVRPASRPARPRRPSILTTLAALLLGLVAGNGVAAADELEAQELPWGPGLWPASEVETYLGDADQDTLSEAYEYELARTFLPEVWWDRGEGCPGLGGFNPPFLGRLAYEVQPFYDSSVPLGGIIIRYIMLLQRDCGLHSHNGDAERFIVVVTPNYACPTGYGFHSLSVNAHDGTAGETNNTAFGNGECSFEDATMGVFVARNKHGTWLRLDRCNASLIDSCGYGKMIYGGRNSWLGLNMGEIETAHGWIPLHPDLRPVGYREAIFAGERFCGGLGSCDGGSPGPLELLLLADPGGPPEGIVPTGSVRLTRVPEGANQAGQWVEWKPVVLASRYAVDLYFQPEDPAPDPPPELVSRSSVSEPRWRVPTSLAPGHYWVEVRAANQYGLGLAVDTAFLTISPSDCDQRPLSAPLILAPSGTVSTQPQLRWQGDVCASAYDVELYPGGAPTPILSRRVAGLAWQLDDELDCDAEYALQVRAVNDFFPDGGPWSDLHGFVTHCEVVLPRAPSLVTALPVVGGFDQVVVDWRDESDNEDGFLVQRLRAGDTHPVLFYVDANETSFLDTVPTVPEDELGTETYFYRVRAYNAAGGAESEERGVAKMFGSAPGRARTLRPRGCISTLQPTLSWQGDGHASQFYARLLDAASGEEAMPDGTPAEPSLAVPAPLVAGRSYLLRVWGMNNQGWGGGSDPELFVPFCQPYEPPHIATPLGCTADSTPLVEWSEVPGAPSYLLRLHRVVDIDHDVEVIPGGVGRTTTSWQVPAGLLQPGQEYRLKVKAVTGGLDSYSVLRFFTPQCNPAAAPGTASPVAPSGGPVPTALPTFSWEAAAQAESYHLEVWTPSWQLAASYTLAAAQACDPVVCRFPAPAPLADGSYHWHLQATNSHGSGLWGPWASFALADTPPSVGIADATVLEGTGGETVALLAVELSRPRAVPVTVSYQTLDGSAAAGSDYVATGGTLTFPPGTTRQDVEVAVVGDAVDEPEESLTVQLASPGGAVLGRARGQLTIYDDDLPELDARFVSQDVPATMVAGQSYTVRLAFYNAGSRAWSPIGATCNSFRLGAANPYGNTTWGPSRLELPSAVDAGGNLNLEFTVTAPALPGSYAFAWRLLEECVAWFGEASPSTTITVRAGQAKDAQLLAVSVPPAMHAGQSYPASVRVKNVGSTAWKPVGPQCYAYRLGAANPYGNTLWGPSRVDLAATLAPGAEVTLNFTVTAPASPGAYSFDWQMVHECVEWFGDPAPAQSIEVTP